MDGPGNLEGAFDSHGTQPGESLAYSPRTVRWLVGDRPLRVLELGAGDGAMTTALTEQDHDVVAVDVAADALDRLSRRVDVTVVRAAAERLPFSAGSFDVVLAAQAFHQFDAARALPEIARVLRTGGRLGLVWHVRDESVPWARRLSALIGSDADDLADVAERLPLSGLFSLPEQSDHGVWHRLDLDGLLTLVRTRPQVASLDPGARERVLSSVRTLYDSYASGHNGLRMRYATRCFSAEVHKDALPPERPTSEGDLAFRL
ncbi:methyltransferase family protein [Mumia flava]|uniref:Methyltransferase family protein n=1 Tax=Mumia flava TaxID=1348852 RepID=A0A2M9BHF8_9ACTN|nr:class I SAM-dependent methyltransferase [Mumia flava]PJJ57379.1 methyltransferase family protein [Mumia flava]